MHLENIKDGQLLALRSVGPLDTFEAVGASELAVSIGNHNSQMFAAVARLRSLNENREQLCCFDAWQSAGSADIMKECKRVKCETWDVLWALRRLLEDRAVVLTHLESRLRENHRCACVEHDRAVAAAERELSNELRALQKANPPNMQSHWASLVAENETVVKTVARMDQAEAALSSIADARRTLLVDLATVQKRRREVFAAIVA